MTTQNPSGIPDHNDKRSIEVMIMDKKGRAYSTGTFHPQRIHFSTLQFHKSKPTENAQFQFTPFQRGNGSRGVSERTHHFSIVLICSVRLESYQQFMLCLVQVILLPEFVFFLVRCLVIVAIREKEWGSNGFFDWRIRELLSPFSLSSSSS